MKRKSCERNVTKERTDPEYIGYVRNALKEVAEASMANRAGDPNVGTYDSVILRQLETMALSLCKRLSAALDHVEILRQDNSVLEAENTEWQVKAGLERKNQLITETLALKVRVLLHHLCRTYEGVVNDEKVAELRKELDLNIPEKIVRTM